MSKIIKKFNPKFPHFRKNKHVKTKQKYFLIISRTISKFGSELKSNCVLMKTISKNKLQALKLLEIDRNLLKKYSKHSFLYPSKKKNKCPWEINIPVALQKEVTKIMNSKPGKIAINDKPELDAIGDNEEIQEYDEDSVDTGDLIIHISSSSSECSSPEKFNIIQDDNQFDHVESDEKCYEDQMDFECQYCSTKFKQQKSLDFHIEKQHLEIDIQNKFSSTHLDKLLQCKQILKEHLNIHDVSNYNLKCHECDKFFSNSLHLSLHKETHLVDYEYDCEKCDKKFKTKNLLNCHQCVLSHSLSCDNIHSKKTHHTLIDNRCGICGSSFKDRKTFLRHSFEHADEPFVECPICLKRFFKETHLLEHIKSHNAECVECKHCKKSFRRDFLRKHIRDVHTLANEKFKCPHCNKAFTRTYNLKKHMKSHEKFLESQILLNEPLIL